MRFQWKSLLLVAGMLFYCPAAFAVSNTIYLAAREKVTVTGLDMAAPLAAQFPAHAGAVIELTGTINGIFTGYSQTVFMMRLDNNQTVTIGAKVADTDIAISNTIRVLARIPARGSMLEALSESPNTPQLALAASQHATTTTVTTNDTAADLADAIIDPPDNFHIPVFQNADYAGNVPPTPEAPGTAAAIPANIAQLYANRIKQLNNRLDVVIAQQIALQLLAKSEQYGVDARLVFALVQHESRFNPLAVSPKGAQGLGQLMPGTAAILGVSKPFDIEQNLDGAVRYLSNQLRDFGRLSLALAAYNAGPNAVRRAGGVPGYSETQRYVRNIWHTYCGLAGLDPQTGQLIAAR